MDKSPDMTEENSVTKTIDFCIEKAKEQNLPYVQFYFENMSSHAVSELDASKQRDNGNHAKFVYVMQ